MKIRRAVTLASLLYFGICSPSAFSSDLDSILKSYLGIRKGDQLTGNQAAIVNNINTRQGQLEKEIEDGEKSGQLTPSESSELRLQLNKVASMEANYLVDRELSTNEVQSLVDELTNVTQKLHAYLTNTTVVGAGVYRKPYGGFNDVINRYAGTGESNDYPPNQSMIQANINTRQAELEAQVEAGLKSGAINWEEANNIRNKLNEIRNDTDRYMRDGRLTYKEKDDLVSHLDQIAAKVQRFSVNTNYNNGRGNAWGRRWKDDSNNWVSPSKAGTYIDSQQSMLHQRILSGQASGRITSREASMLFRKEQRINELEAQLRGTNGRLNYQEQKTLLAQLDTLRSEINNQLNDRDRH